MIRPKLWVAGHKLYNTKDMNPSAPGKNQSKYDNPLEVMSPGEQNLCAIDRHPFGMIGLYVIAGFVVIASLVAGIVAPNYLPNATSSLKMGILLIAIMVAFLSLLYLYVGMIVYKGNRWIVTSDSITQISQTSLFNKQTSQLSLANLEDVTYEQDSVIQHMFGFGTLKVETAGERSKFSFPFCPQPDNYARMIIKAHEDFIRQHPEDAASSSGLDVNTNTAPVRSSQPQAAANGQDQFQGYSVPNGDDDES